jgi:(2R)-sulfolactate sulfo-lyase subunit alpha
MTESVIARAKDRRMPHQFLIHDAEDVVGVAVEDLSPGSATGRVQSTGEAVQVEVRDAVPLGHKVALCDLEAGQPVIKYGIAIGLTTAPVRTGQHVHVHNLKGQRWV